MNIRTFSFVLVAFAAGAAAWTLGSRRYAAPLRNLADRILPGHDAEHVPTDLVGDTPPGPGDRAPVAFRPDPTAIPTAQEREALRPATIPAPTMVD